MQWIQDFIEYINTCIASTSIGAYVSLGCLALIALLALSGLLFGLIRGFSKSTIRFITIAGSAVGAFMIAASVSNWLFTYIEARTLEQLITSIYPDYQTLGEDIRGIVSSIDLPTLEHLIAFVLCIMLPIAFIVMFILFNAVTMLVYWLFSGLMAITSYGKSNLSTIAGGLVGMVQGVFIALVIIFPVAELSVVADHVRSDLTTDTVSAGITEKVDTIYDEHLDIVIKNPVFKAIHKYGGGGLYNSLTTVKINGVDYVMVEQTENMAQLFSHVSSLIGFDFKAPNAEDKAVIDAIISDIDDTPYVAEIIAGALRTFGTVIDNSYYKIDAGELMTDIVRTTLAIFKDSTTDTLHNDLVTVKEVYYILADNNLFSILTNGDTEEIAKTLSESKNGKPSIINQVTTILDANPHTRPVVASLTKISLSVMAESTGMATEEMEELYNNVHSGVTDILKIEFTADPETMTEQEYEEAKTEYTNQISDQLKDTLTENNIEGITQETIDEMAAIIAEQNIERQKEGNTEITDANVNDAILSYYEAYAKQNGLSGDISQDFPDGIPGVDTEGGSEE